MSVIRKPILQPRSPELFNESEQWKNWEEMSNLQEDAKPEIIVDHSNVDVIAALLVPSIIVRALGIGDRQVSYGDRVLKDCKD
jgi:hypothetical protein